MNHADEQAEWWVLGALLEYDAASLLAAHPVRPEDFAAPERALAFRAVESLVQQGRPVTLDGVLLLLRGTAAAGLMVAANAAVDARGWGPERFGPVVGRLRELHRARKLEAHLQAQLGALRTAKPDALALLKGTEEFARDLESGVVEQDRTGADDLLELAEDWEHADERPQRIPTGIHVLDEGDGQTFHGIGGWVPNINILAGRPGSMKSATATVAAWNQLQAGLTVGFVGLEEGTKFIQKRLIAQRMGMRVGAVAATRLHEHQHHGLMRAMEELHGPMQRLLVSATATNPAVLERTIQRWIVTKGVRVVYVDHVAEIDHALQVRDRLDLAIKGTLLRLRRLAIRHGVAIVLLAHLNRDAGEGRPKKEHLKESGYLEDMGRLILGMWDDARWPERALVDVLKGNEAQGKVTMWLPRIREAALVDSVGGGVLDWQEVEREQRAERQRAVGGWRRGAGVGTD